jgi:hypothetical protein
LGVGGHAEDDRGGSAGNVGGLDEAFPGVELCAKDVRAGVVGGGFEGVSEVVGVSVGFGGGQDVGDVDGGGGVGDRDEEGSAPGEFVNSYDGSRSWLSWGYRKYEVNFLSVASGTGAAVVLRAVNRVTLVLKIGL